MKKESRKLLSRIGAALMLGLSLFNFGAAWSKLKGGALPKKARNIRKQTREEVDPEIQQVSSIAENEAKAVLATEQLQQEQTQQLQENAMTVFQRTIRYSAITVWALSAGLVFTSVVFNYPFGMGKGLLSLLPGEPHVVSMSLIADNEIFQTGERIKVAAKLNTNGEPVEKARMVITYDPTQLQFENYEINGDLFDQVKEQNVDQNKGRFVLSLESTTHSIISKNDEIGSIFFKAIERTRQSEIGLIQEESSVIKQKNGDFHNILGKVVGAKFRITGQQGPTVVCDQIDAGDNNDPWESLAQSKILPDENSRWNEIADDWAFLCAHKNSSELYLLVSSTNQQLSSINIDLGDSDETDVFLNIEKKWQQGDQYFFGSVIKNVESTEDSMHRIQDVMLRVNTPNSALRWPERGYSTFILQ